jgi:acyl-CoA synthetase (AMP-forming)/AMP-acid ligase II
MRLHQTLDRDHGISYPNVGALFSAKAQQYPDKTFLSCPGKKHEQFSYKVFGDNFQLLAAYLRGLGLSKGDRFNLIADNSPDFLFFYFAGLSAGITVVPINPDLSPQEMLYIIQDSQAKAAFYQESLSAKIDQLCHAVPAATILRGMQAVQDSAQAQEADAPAGRAAANIALDDEAVIIYTSGTSGNPKGVVLSHLNMLADAKSICEWFEFSCETRALCILPLFHNNGQVTTLLAPLYVGGSTAVVRGKASLLSFWDLVEEYHVSFTSVMASILSILLSIPAERKDRTLRGILCGGQVLTRSVQDGFESRFGVPIFEGYGLTETTSFSCINGFPKEKRRPGSIGRPLPSNEMAILDEAGRALGPDTEGEICIRGYNVACEYLGLAERNKTSFAGGWFHSGDYGRKDADDYFYFHGRRDFLIIKGGENIYGAELENVLYKHPAVAECAVIGIPDKLLGEDICAFVKTKDGAELSEQELKAFCKGKIAPYKQAKKILIVDALPDLPEIPKGPTKKVLYRKLKEYYEAHLGAQQS